LCGKERRKKQRTAYPQPDVPESCARHNNLDIFPGIPRALGTMRQTKLNASIWLLALSTWLLMGVPEILGDTGSGSVSLTTVGSAVTQNFDSLSNTPGSTTNTALPTGWYITEQGGGPRDNEQYAVDDGTSTTGDIYSYGAAASTERALGALRSGTLIPFYGAKFTNNTGATITSLDVSYTGEEWRFGTTGRTDRIDFQISTNATDLTTGTYADVDALDFTTPDTAGAVGPRNGNAAADRTAISATISSLSIPNGATFFVRWTDLDATGADDGLAVDDFSLTPNISGGPTPTPSATPPPSPTPTPSGTPAPIRIHDIQGAAHLSPLSGQVVANVPGIVTAKVSNGFYLQDPLPDANDATSEGIFVFTSTAPTVNVGDSVLVGGTVAEFRSGGSGSTNLTGTEITAPTVSVQSTGNPLPAPIVLGTGGRIPPATIIEDDAAGSVETGGIFDPATDGIDFYESLEAMRVQVNNAVVVGPRGSIGEIPVLADDGANASVRTTRGGIVVRATDFNPERIILDDLILATPVVNVGDHFSTSVVGVMDYSFGNFKLLITQPLTAVAGGLAREVTSFPLSFQIAVATFNVENLDPGDPPSKFAALASLIVNNLRSPDIIALEEIQDNNGPTDNGVVDATTTYNTLIAAIQAAAGPTYTFRQINPVNDQDGGEPGGNIRVGFLFRTDRGLAFTDRAGGCSTCATTVANGPSGVELSFSPGRVDPTNTAFTASRKPLAGEFTFSGQKLFVIANHFNSKGGDDPLFGRFQPPILSSEVQRTQQAQVVNNFVDSILALNGNAKIVVLGDLNDFSFSTPLNTLKGGVLHALIETLPQSERYTYVFEGNSQDLDHILLSDGLFSGVWDYDVVHVNSEFADQISDHDPQIVRLAPAVIPTPTPTASPATPTPSPTPSPTATATPSPSVSPTATVPPTATPSPSDGGGSPPPPTPTATATVTATIPPTPTVTPATPTPTVTPSPSSPTPLPTCNPGFNQGFDDITTLPAGGWVQTNHSTTVGTTGWFQGNDAVFPAHQGTLPNSYIGANFNNTTGTNTISNWLLTPAFQLQNGITMHFWTRTTTANPFPDRLQVRMSTAGAGTNVGITATDVGDFTSLLLDINPTYTVGGYPEVWTVQTVTITGVPVPTQGRLAFRYFVENGGPTGTNSNYIGIDTFDIFLGDCPPTPTPSPTATASTTPTASATPTATATIAPSVTPTATATVAPSPSPTATIGVSPSPSATPPTQAINLSTRMRVQTGNNAGVGGLIISGNAPKQVLLRAIGPSLIHFGVPGVLADPVMELHGPGAFATITNNNWRDTQEAAIQATGIPPTDDLESAILVTLNPGAYTAIVRGNNGNSGVGLIEIYDLNRAAASKLANLSTRAFVSTGSDVVIAGFLLSEGNPNDRIVVRGIGPSLAPNSFPVSAVLADPTLELRDANAALLIANNDWQDDPAQAALLIAAGLAPTNNLESGVAATLPPGLYTAILAGLNNGTGIGLVEVYDLGP
jgi:predicted extracellular nuclease